MKLIKKIEIESSPGICYSDLSTVKNPNKENTKMVFFTAQTLFGEETFINLLDPEKNENINDEPEKDFVVDKIKIVNDECLLAIYGYALTLITFKSSEKKKDSVSISQNKIQNSNPFRILNFFISNNKIVLLSEFEIHFYNFLLK